VREVSPIRVLRYVAGAGVCVACAIALGGCVTTTARTSGSIATSDPVEDGLPMMITPTVQRDADVKYFPSDQPLRMGIEHFARGDYGLSQQYFRDAVQQAPKDASAWIGLAASYDHLGRFDLADQAYGEARRLAGETTEYLNNRGYSYLLRGNLIAARREFMKAYAREPNNPVIINNIRLLNGSRRFIVRAADTEPPDAYPAGR
jgi:Flp pilus assembly protein TadD